jgi:putative CocE/NonD family hydrolase
MIKKSLAAIVLLAVVIVGLGYLNLHHIMRIKYNLSPFTHEAGEKFVEQVVMRDGVKLNTRVFLPKGVDSKEGHAWPAILMRNPYKILDRVLIVNCDVFVRYGYACVLQHTRGQGESEGVWEPLINEPSDGSDTLYWLAEQTWVDGNIGMWGVSYLALVQWAAASDYPPELKTLVPISMGTDFHKTLFENGAFRHFVTWWMMVMPSSAPDMDNAKEENFLKAAKHMPHSEVDEVYTDFKLEWYKEWVASAEQSATIWKRADAFELEKVAENLDIPVLMIDGWYDPFFGSLFQDYLDLGSREKSVMVIGPWNHMQQVAGDALNDDVEDASEVSMQMSLVWFDYYLKNNKNENHKAGYIKVYDVGVNEWLRYETWPPENKKQILYLSNFDSANSCQGGKLQFSENPFNEKVDYIFDPENPVMTLGGSGFIVPLSDDLKPGAIFQGNVCERDDVLTFITEPLENDLTITGEIRINLMVSSDAQDTMFTAKLIDVLPNGDAVNIRDSATTLTLRNGVSRALVYEPSSIVQVSIDTWAIHWTLQAGHKLRLDISSSNFPAFNIHSNFSGPWETQTKRKVAQQTIYTPATIELPVKSKPIQ